jgi:hypothetical protein
MLIKLGSIAAINCYSGNPSKRAPSKNLSAGAYPTSNIMRLRKLLLLHLGMGLFVPVDGHASRQIPSESDVESGVGAAWANFPIWGRAVTH